MVNYSIFYLFLFFIISYSVRYDSLCEFNGSGFINLSFQGLSKDSQHILVVDGIIPSGYDDSVVMIIQIQGGTINTTNTADYGGNDGTGRGYISIDSGFYEFNIIHSYISGGGETIINLQNQMLYDYRAGGNNNFQVLLVPYCETMILSNTIKAKEWDGSTGGIISLLATNLIIEESTIIDVSGLGFRGGPDMDFSETDDTYSIEENYADNTANIPGNAVKKNAHKGEGICGSPQGLGNPSISTYANGWDSARGAPCNAGGGGNYRDTGGGGGANGGNGGEGVRYLPGQQFHTGLGGVTCPYDIFNIFFGGGGGCGHRNLNGPDGPFLRGMNGGGIIYMHVEQSLTIENNISILSSGIDGFYNATYADGGGGGGAGGTVVLLYNQDSGTSWHGMNIDVSGGNGTTSQIRHGGGGGGSGGVFISTSQVPTMNFDDSGGQKGESGAPFTGDNGDGGSITDDQSGYDFPSQIIFNVPLTLTPSISISKSISLTSSKTQSPTPPETPSPSPSAFSSTSKTPTPSISNSTSPTRTPTRSRTPHRSPSKTKTSSTSRTKTQSLSSTGSNTTTVTPTPSQTVTVTPTSTLTITSTPTSTISSTPTSTLSSSGTPTSTVSQTSTPTSSSTLTITSTPSPTSSSSSTTTPTPTSTLSKSRTSSITESSSTSLSRTESISISNSNSISLSRTPLSSKTSSRSISTSVSLSSSGSITHSPSNTQSISHSTSNSISKTSSITSSISKSATSTMTPSTSFSSSSSISLSKSLTSSRTISISPTSSRSESKSHSSSLSQDVNISNSESISKTKTKSKSHSLSNSISFSKTNSPSDSSSISQSLSTSESLSISLSSSKSSSKSESFSISPSITSSSSISFSNSQSISISLTPSQSEDIVGPTQGIPTLIIDEYTLYSEESLEDESNSDNNLISVTPSTSVHIFGGTQVYEENIIITSNDYEINLVVNEVTNFIIPTTGSLQSSVFNIIAVNEYGEEIQPSDNVEICLSVEDTDIKDDSCLSYYNEETNEWECEDECLQIDDENRLCGNTNHFTSFAILFEGTGGNGNACGSSINHYIFDEAWQDLILILSVTCFICCLALLFLLFGVCTKPGALLIGGDQAERIRHSRKRVNGIQYTIESYS